MIDRIVIENYKSIKKVDIKLNMINVLIGSNGAEYILYHGRKVSENLKARIELTDGSSTYYS
ncbi:MAG: hypothetical protein ACRCTS_07445 [Fusobacteriaceae bacterium]